MEVERMRAVIGPRADYYLARFQKIEGAGGGWVPSWNFAAFFFSAAWFSYRRMDSWAYANFFLLLGGTIAWLAQSLVTLLACLVVAFVIIPIYANAVYFRSLTSRLAKADSAKSESAANTLKRPLCMGKLGGAVFVGAVAFIVPVFLAMAWVPSSDFDTRAKVAEGDQLARSLSEELAAFHANHRRMPGPQEAAEFRVKVPMRFTESVVYDADRKMIVVTMRDDGKRFAMQATEKDGALVWTCHTIDLKLKYLPSTCHN